ncbi:LuxR C-terminal-related transcriptional regulator [Zoogloea sp.]|uniref:helix-turn-helix transcriptional regulator n=1 Tax=Zoogloea sp. TaxID=49181 RepID=UPI0026147537|nr:LuxR C-terminal-related transcriptional regulator [Zoogloea sp.]MDD3352653.1 LuxR C-terminal-related transcriptional regulator [Zoogloea sp.]
MNDFAAGTLGARDLERLLGTLEGAVQVRRRSDFYLWSQGALQSFLPHETLLCLSGRGGGVEVFSRGVVAPEWEGYRPGQELEWAVALRRHWQHGGGRPCRELPSLLRLALACLPGAGGPALVHGHGDSGARAGVLFVFLGLPREGGARECYFAELLLPHLRHALERIQGAQETVDNRIRLSARQAEILAGIRSGKTNVQIADDLGLSPLTVKHHVQELLRKLKVSNRTEAALSRVG